MQQPTVIDAKEIEQSAKEAKLRKSLGCLLKAIPIFTVGMAVLLVGVWTYLYFTAEEPTEEELAAEEAAEAAAAGRQAPSSPEALEDALAANAEMEEAIGGRSEADRARLMEEKFGHLRDDAESVAGEGVAAGEESEGLYGEEGAVSSAASLDPESNYLISEGVLEVGARQLNYEVIYQEWEDGLRYRFFVFPYDAGLNDLMYTELSHFTLQFMGVDEEQVLPVDSDLQVPLNKFNSFKKDGVSQGWVAAGKVPLEDVLPEDVTAVKLGWHFEQNLSDYLAGSE